MGTHLRRCRGAVSLVLLILAVLAPPGAGLSQAQNAADCQSRQRLMEQTNTPLSSCLSAGRNATIGQGNCTNVYVDQSFTGANALGTVTIRSGGQLLVPDRTLNIETVAIIVQGTSTTPGLFQVGTQACPIGMIDPANKVTITFVDSATSPLTDDPVCDPFTKGIQVRLGGQLRLYGDKGVPPEIPSWTRLREPAGPALYKTAANAASLVKTDDKTLRLNKNVTRGRNAWRVGDWLVVGTTSFSPFESEFVQIARVISDTEVTLVHPLRHYHYGSPDPGLPSQNYSAGAEKNYGVDERAEVGLISRNIKLTAAVNPATSHKGGEIRMCPGFAEATIQGVELEKFGKEQLGSYPLHFHMTGDVANKPLVNALSIHHSYNKCVAIHSTSKLTVQNTVCARAVGHLFYQEMGDENNISFLNNLGLGAMSNSFDIDASAVPLVNIGGVNVPKNYWEGDNLARVNGYDGLKIRNTDKQSNPTHGSCFVPDPNAPGSLKLVADDPVGSRPNAPHPPCLQDKGEYYVEPASGFWLTNPGTVLQGNSIGGCQGIGVGYWYVPAADGSANAKKFQAIPRDGFKNNRAHGCYNGIFGETMFGVTSEQLFPRVGGVNTGKALIARFDGFTATRNRDRGIWMRPTWFVFQDARLATNRDSVTLVSSGGNDGNAPGVWALLKDSVLVGLSMNNVDRWGPCPHPSLGNGPGCVDHNPKANDVFEREYQTPRWNSAGYMIYDGPVRIEHNRFVNFHRDIRPYLTTDDRTALSQYVAFPNPLCNNNVNCGHEGDAALAWFQNNQSAYPTATISKQLSFENTDLRHQVYTEQVNLGDFRDGDKNTAILDLDGTLTGFEALDSTGNKVDDLFPISLNNLPFNASSHSVDECLAEGRQDTFFEKRPTSLISPESMATLEFMAQWPTPEAKQRHDQLLTFAKDMQDYDEHQTMSLKGRDGHGVWEPKVTSGYGYTVSAAVDPTAQAPTGKAGIPAVVTVGFTDAVKPDINPDNPFYVRLGICYTNNDANKTHPAGNFTITRGYKSWGGNGVYDEEKDLYFHWTKLLGKYNGQTCHNLDNDNVDGVNTPLNLDPVSGCPGAGFTRRALDSTCPNRVEKGGICPNGTGGKCPAGTTLAKIALPQGSTQPQDQVDICVYPTQQLTTAGSLSGLKHLDGTPDLTKYYYDATTGMLFFYVAQEHPNAVGTSPLGSCTGKPSDDPACPNSGKGESYFSCPPQGCSNYTVRLAGSYDPGPSNCNGVDSTGIYLYQGGIYAQAPPANQNRLAYVVPNGANPTNGIQDGESVTPVECKNATDCGGTKLDFPHTKALLEPWCPGGSSR